MENDIGKREAHNRYNRTWYNRKVGNLPPMPTAEERFWARVEKTPTCWLWTGPLSGGGYGRIKVGGEYYQVHRYSWLLAGKALVKGLQLDHVCRVRHCVNPSHLEQVTQKENTLRGIGITAIQSRQTHCKNGHPLTEDNLFKYTNNNARRCKMCRSAWVRARKERMAT